MQRWRISELPCCCDGLSAECVSAVDGRYEMGYEVCQLHTFHDDSVDGLCVRDMRKLFSKLTVT